MAKMLNFKPLLALSSFISLTLFAFGLSLASSPSAQAQISLKLEGHYPYYGDTSDLFTTVNYRLAYGTPKLTGDLGFAATLSYQVTEIIGIGLRVGQYGTKYTRTDKFDPGPVLHEHEISTIVIMPEVNGHYWIDENKNYGLYGAFDAGYVRNKFTYASWHYTELTTLLFNTSKYVDFKSKSSGLGSGLEVGFEYNGYEKHDGPTLSYFIGTRIDWLGSFQNAVTYDLRGNVLTEQLTLYSIVSGLTINY